jgi:hypothetical protein
VKWPLFDHISGHLKVAANDFFFFNFSNLNSSHYKVAAI